MKSTLFGGTTDFNVNVFYELISDYQNKLVQRHELHHAQRAGNGEPRAWKSI